MRFVHAQSGFLEALEHRGVPSRDRKIAILLEHFVSFMVVVVRDNREGHLKDDRYLCLQELRKGESVESATKVDGCKTVLCSILGLSGRLATR